jgi:hypothetical protein
VDQLTVEESRQILDDELERLPDKYRAPLLLCCLEGKSREEAARELGWSEGAVKIRLERGRQRLRDRLARRGLGLGSVLGVSLLMPGSVSAVLPARLTATTVAGALQFAAGQSLTGTAAALAMTLLRTLALARIQTWAAGLALLATVGMGVGYAVLRVPAAPPPLVPNVPSAHESLAEPRAYLPPVLKSVVDGPIVLGVVRAVDGDQRTVTVRAREKDQTYLLGPDFELRMDGQIARFSDLRVAQRVQLTLTADGREVRRIQISGPILTGVLRSLDPAGRIVTMLGPGGDGKPPVRTFSLAENVTARCHDEPLPLADLRPGATVCLQMTADGRRVLQITLLEN